MIVIHTNVHTHTCTECTLRPSRWWPYSFFPRLTLTIHYRPQTKPIPHPPPCNTYTHTSTHMHAKCPIILPLGRWRSQNLACPSVSVDTLSFQTVPALLWLNLLTFLILSPWLKFLLLHFINPQQEWGASDDSLYYTPPFQSCYSFFNLCSFHFHCLASSGNFPIRDTIFFLCFFFPLGLIYILSLFLSLCNQMGKKIKPVRW